MLTKKNSNLLIQVQLVLYYKIQRLSHTYLLLNVGGTNKYGTVTESRVGSSNSPF